MTHTPEDLPRSLNAALSDVLDVVQEVKQAHRKVPETHALHIVLDRLFDDLSAWAQALLAQDRALGVSPFAHLPSVAGRRPRNLWPSEVSEDDVRLLLDEHLTLLGRHIAAAAEAQIDEASRETLFAIDRAVAAHRATLSGLSG